MDTPARGAEDGVRASGEQRYAAEFTGTAGEYFRIWIVNLALTILTFGIYSAWAKVRKRRYFYAHTRIAGESFEYRGRPVAILIGRLLALALLVFVVLVGNLVPELSLESFSGKALFFAAAVLIGPWLLVLGSQQALGPMLDATVRVAFLHQPRYMHVPLPPLLPIVPTDLSTNVVWGPPPYLLYVKTMLYLPLVAVVTGWLVTGTDAWCCRLFADAKEWRAPARRAALPLLVFATLALATVADRADYYHLRQVLSGLGVLVMPQQVQLGHADKAFDAEGRLVDEHAGRALERAVRALVEIAGKLA